MKPAPERLTDAYLLRHIERLPHARASYKQLVRELGLKGGARTELERALESLSARGDVLELRSGQYTLTRGNREYSAGRLNMHRDGYGFVVPDQPVDGMRGDIFIPKDEAGRAMHGDRVIARILRIEKDGRADGEILKVLRRAHQTVVGEFQVRRQGTFVRPHDERISQWIEIPDGMAIPPAAAVLNRVGVEPRRLTEAADLDGLIVNVEIVDFGEHGEEPVGRVIEVLGAPDDFGIDVEIIIRKHHIPHQFPPAVLEEAENLPATIAAEEIARRMDFRGLDVVTIDGETARDFDDAVWVDKLPNGNYALQVHIADVGHYVRPGSAIDAEAALRGTSVYFPDRAVPMLPVELSTEICSLKPDVERLVLSALLEIDPGGDVVAQNFTRGVIRSVQRMTYTNVHLLLEGDAALREHYGALTSRFELMKELALKLNRKRHKRGSIDFDMPEPLIEFDLHGEMKGIVRSPRNVAHRIIEEFMLAANEAVAGHLEHAELPSIYRIHEDPDPKRILEFEELAARFGYSLGAGGVPVKKFRQVERKRDGRRVTTEIVIPNENFRVSSRNYQRLVARLEGKPEERVLTYLMLRSLKQAKYSARNAGHYALAADSYTHFTSPIRRYPDLLVHRILSQWMDHRSALLPEDELALVAEDCSRTERRADDAERELVEWKKARFMEDRVGEQFAGLIISVTRFGFFVELDNVFIEGLVPIDSLPGDHYKYYENARRIIGERSRREYSIGDRVEVLLVRVDAMEKKLTFGVVQTEPQRRFKRKRRE